VTEAPSGSSERSHDERTNNNNELVRRTMSLPFAILALVESLILYSSLWAGAYIRFGGDLQSAHETIGSLAPRAALFAIVAVLALLSVGLYRSRQNARSIETLIRLVTAFAFAAFIDAAFYYFVPTLSTGRGAQALALVIGFLGLTATRGLFYAFAGHDRFKRNVLVLGFGANAAALARVCAHVVQPSFRIVGYLGMLGEEVADECVPVLPRCGPILGLVRDLRVDEIVVALDNRRSGTPTRELLDCRMAGVRVSEVLTFAERETGRIDLRSLYPSWFIYGAGFRQGMLQQALKRQFDIFASLALLVIALPLIAAGALAILIESRGKGGVFLRQQRVGKQGAVFEMLKLRSMVPLAERDGRAQWAAPNDPRVTRVGAFLRRFRIDELPQIFNILRGQMSFVGPRPERPSFVDLLSEQIPFYSDRHTVKPGLAGWAQLCYPYGASVEDARQKLQYDLFYVKNHTPMLDLLILLETLEVVLWGRGRSVHVVTGPTDETASKRHIA
jgi:sugar transferase (PEP-CTERM system associated)